MMTGMFTSAAAIDAHEKRHEVSAANLANISTPGYRRRIQLFEAPEPLAARLQGKGVPTPRSSVALDFTPGDVVHTGNRLDLALVNPVMSDGNAFFAFSTANGNEGYARTARLNVSAKGYLVQASSGYTLEQPNGAPIQLTPDGGEVTVDGRGAVYQGGEALGQIKIVRFGRLDAVKPMDHGLFEPRPGNKVSSAEGMVEVRQAHLEMSNANSIDELVAMVANYRAYEASQKTLKQMDTSVRTLIRQTSR